MRGLIFTIPLLLALSACERPEVNQAEADVRAQLKDPDSAVFTRIRIADKEPDDPTVVCGLVNAKNSYGGYAGPRRFYVMLPHNLVVLDLDPGSPGSGDALADRSFDLSWNMMRCQLASE